MTLPFYALVPKVSIDPLMTAGTTIQAGLVIATDALRSIAATGAGGYPDANVSTRRPNRSNLP